jgi:hypothetical protein
MSPEAGGDQRLSSLLCFFVACIATDAYAASPIADNP